MSRDAVIESWLASMSKSELIDQCFFYQDMALKHGRMYNALKDESAKLREERDYWHVEQVHAYGNWEDAYKRAAELELENAKLREQLVEESSERVILNDWHFEIADALGIHYEDDNDVDCNDLGENNLNEVKKTIAETNEMILVISDLMNSYADADVPHTNCHKCTASKRCSGSPCILIDDVRRRMIEIGVEV